MSKKMACCMLKRTRRFNPGFPERTLSTRKLTKPENGIDLYSVYSNASAITSGLSWFSITRNRPNCRLSISGKRYGSTERILSFPLGAWSLMSSSLACASTAFSAASCASLAASSACFFSSRAKASSLLRNLSMPTNSSSCNAPSPDTSKSSINLRTRFSGNSVLRTFSSPAFSSSNVTSPSLLVSNFWNAFSAALASSWARSASNAEASARNLAAMDCSRSISSSALTCWSVLLLLLLLLLYSLIEWNWLLTCGVLAAALNEARCAVGIVNASVVVVCMQSMAAVIAMAESFMV
mmetsp:Transcript_27052/g.76107  ORF Transcript_27052/g.76107 Transcript_27052/m.76107 type:complete len:295 (-) Transcript_27052:270-1154(-)